MINKFVKPLNLDEALECISNDKYKIIAGGTDVIIKMRENKEDFPLIIDISSLNELKTIEVYNEYIRLGSLCTHGEIEKNEIVKLEIPILAKGCGLVGSTLVRNRGTLGGNIVNNSNCADSVPPLLLLDASVNISRYNSKRSVELKDFFMNCNNVLIEEDEILTSIDVKPLVGYKWDLVKVGRRKSLAISRITLAIAIKMQGDFIEDLRICPGAMLSKPQRLWNTEDFAKGLKLDTENIEKIADKAVEEVIDVSGVRWSSEYKNPVLKGLIIRSIDCFKE